ncbi:MAG TPA: hypothetical protein P5270_04330 [Victivallales bacterium]|nr:hypothetical protein [Victivallales bacterium]HPO89625.1 hypothetical protein [Victivallales bacterium]HRR28567.1 hypothetical protein [Victivallales bacterium]
MFSLSLSLIAGFFLPGYFIVKFLRAEEEIASSFVVSCVILFNIIFYLGILRCQLTFTSIIITLFVVNVILFFFAWKRVRRDIFNINFKIFWDKSNFIYYIPFFSLFILLLLKAFLQPYGYAPGDQLFRWDFLAYKIFEEKNFSFYPPVKAEDFYHYLYPDGLPPMVSFLYFWLYESFGSYITSLTGILVVTQFVTLSLLCYAIFKRNYGSLSPFFLFAVISSSSLLFYSIHIGQESCFIGISLTGVILYLFYSEKKNSSENAILAGFFAALGALSREYGYIIFITSILLLVGRRNIWYIIIFLLSALIFSLPWYVRNLYVAGNPFYSNDFFALFNVNKVHIEIFNVYKEHLSLFKNLQSIVDALLTLLAISFVPLVFGIAGIFLAFRRYMLILLFLISFIGLWIYSVALTPGGILHSLRVLAPLIPILSISSCEIFNKIRKKNILLLFIFFMDFLSLLQSFTIPVNIFRAPKKYFWDFSFGQHIFYSEEELAKYAKLIDKNTVILTDEAIFHSQVSRHPEYNMKTASIWSPEFEFLFNKRLTAKECLKRLKEKNIHYLCINKTSLNFIYFKQYPFFSYIEGGVFPNLTGNLYKITDN